MSALGGVARVAVGRPATPRGGYTRRQCVRAADAFLGAPLPAGACGRVGLGLAALGRPGYINLGRGEDLAALGADRSEAAMREHCYAVLDEAYDAGVRYFDAARSYGLSEAFLAGWLDARGLRRGDVIVGSKWGYRYTAGWRVDTDGEPHEVKEHSVTNLRAQVQESVALLGDHVALYQVHSATLDSGFLDADVLQELGELKSARGWKLGLTLSGTAQADTLREALRRAPGLFDCVQATYNVLEQSAGEALDEAGEAGMSVIIKEAMANGRVLRSGPLRETAAALGVPPDALAMGAAMALDCAPVVLSGAATRAHARSNAQAPQAMEALQRCAPDALERLLVECKEDSARYWKDRAALEWN